MKKIIFILFAILILLSIEKRENELLKAENKKEQSERLRGKRKKDKGGSREAKKRNVNTPKIVVKLRGLVCDFCAHALEKVFRKRKEVSRISVDLETKLLTLYLKKGQDLKDKKVRKLVEDAGYNTVAIQRKGGKK